LQFALIYNDLPIKIQSTNAFELNKKRIISKQEICIHCIFELIKEDKTNFKNLNKIQ